VALDLERKKVIVGEVATVAQEAQSAIACEYAGLSVVRMTALRDAARKQGVYLRVVRNTLARRALAGSRFECMSERLVGPLVLAFSRDDAGAAARVIDEYARTNDKLVVKLVSFGGKLLEPDALKSLAYLPTREQALAMLMGVMKAPISKLVRTLAEPYAGLARVLAAVRDQKQAA
jgi:large subunit ribosomal protein L10